MYPSHNLAGTTAQEEAQRLADLGYVGVSNRYRIVVRIDRADWLQHMAQRYNRAVADFYEFRGEHLSNSTGGWGKHYASMFSKDQIEDVHPEVYRLLKKLSNDWDLKYVPDA